MKPLDLVKSAQELWKFIWVPLVILGIICLTMAWVTPQLYSNSISQLDIILNEYASVLELLTTLTSKLNIELVPSVIAYSFLVMFIYFLGGPFYSFIEVIPPHIGWNSGRHLLFASKQELQTLRRKYPISDSFVEAYSLAVNELRANESTKHLFIKNYSLHDYLSTFAKLVALTAIVSAMFRLIYIGFEWSLIFSVLSAQLAALVLWIIASMFLVNDISSSEFAIFEAVINQLYLERDLFEEDAADAEFSESEIALLNSKWWYIRYSTLGEIKYFVQTFFDGFRFRS